MAARFVKIACFLNADGCELGGRRVAARREIIEWARVGVK